MEAAVERAEEVVIDSSFRDGSLVSDLFSITLMRRANDFLKRWDMRGGQDFESPHHGQGKD